MTNTSVIDFLKFAFQFCSFIVVVGGILEIPRVFGFLTGKVAKLTIYDIAGLYQVEMTSNWPTIERLIEASNQTNDSFDVHSPAERPPSLQIIGFAIVEAGVFGMKIRMKMSKTGHQSVSRGEDIRRDEHGQVYLRYVYVQTNAPHGTLPTDVAQHGGAAEVIFNPKMGDLGCLTGRYWTNRNYAKGMNTAGDIKLTRIKRNEYQFPST